ncbi:FAD-dependent oxidoreductase [Arthrobacter sp. ERGS1:01]|uniref:NAD(P)/FAD-dependent oxidoreductase n=1 Tax=Arthrobacter sp. ERGS1:01 TaxID=1704044 RepID=UPI0006B5BE61|nr:FAD-dependent oxidoreductase [Arthrobacter sp. ERGS1:01]ALE05896.1 FAD-dependent oxidoreductase [Arthrobacter sp. ERGS1:01]
MTSTVFEREVPAASVIDAALAGSKPVPFWLDDVGPTDVGQPLGGEHTADLVVVGAGYCGLWTALLAKQEDPGRRVLVLESHTVGWAASGRNGGFVEASLTHGQENGENRFPEEIDRLNELGRQNLDEIEKAVRDLGLDCDFERTGSIDVAIEPYQAAELQASAAAAGQVFLDREAVRAELNSPTYLAGVWHKEETALVHPAKLARELARACRDLGVEIFEHSAATSLVPAAGGGDVVVHTDKGRVRAGRVALATNVFPSLLKRNRLFTVPVYDYVLMTEPLSGEQLASIGWHNRQGLSDVANQFHYYRLSADNRILWGGYDALYHFGREVKSEYEDRPETFRKLASHFFTTFPQLEGVKFTHRWAGAIDTSTRFCAFFGTAHGGRVSYAAGFTGLGVAATHFAAKVMLDHLAGRDTERTRLKMVRSKPLPFPPEPFASVGIQATRWALNRADHNDGKRNLLLKTLDAVGLGFDS